MAMRKGVKRAAKRTGARKNLKSVAPKLYKAVKAVARNEAYKAQETKFVRQFVTSRSAVYNSLTTIDDPTKGYYLTHAVPPLIQGGVSAQLVGSKATLISGYTKFLFNFAATDGNSRDVNIKLFCLYSKAAKSVRVASDLCGGDLLRIGSTSGNVDWNPTVFGDAALMNQLPLNDNAWTGHTHTIRLTKNPGVMNLDSSAGNVPNIHANSNYQEYIWHWHKGGEKVLRYDEPILTGGVNQYPTNFCPLFGYVAWYPDGTASGTAPATMPVQVTVQNFMWYKDA